MRPLSLLCLLNICYVVVVVVKFYLGRRFINLHSSVVSFPIKLCCGDVQLEVCVDQLKTLGRNVTDILENMC